MKKEVIKERLSLIGVLAFMLGLFATPFVMCVSLFAASVLFLASVSLMLFTNF